MARLGSIVCCWLCVALASGACKERAPSEAPAKMAACAQVGQRCEVSPGKLGSCVQVDACKDREKGCFICQSQH